MLGLGPAAPLQMLELRSITALRCPANSLEGIKAISGMQDSRTSTRLAGNLEVFSIILRWETASATHRPQHLQIKGHDEIYEQSA